MTSRDRASCAAVCCAEGIECDEASGGLEALELIQNKPLVSNRGYDLVLLDINMPDVSGLEVCRRLREKEPYPHLKLITLSGFANPDDMVQMLLARADDFLAKPFSVVQLQARVKAILRLKDAQDRSDLLNRHLLSLNQQLEQTCAPATAISSMPATPWCWRWPSWSNTAMASAVPG